MNKEKVTLVKLKDLLEIPSEKLYVEVYTERNNEDRPVKKPRERITLKQVIDMMNDGFKRMDAKMDAGFKQVNARLDYIVKANNLKDLPKSRK